MQEWGRAGGAGEQRVWENRVRENRVQENAEEQGVLNRECRRAKSAHYLCTSVHFARVDCSLP